MCVLIGFVEFIWCIVMPIIGSLHLISSKYKEDNKNKSGLLQHWCYYWVAYFMLRVLFGFLSFLPASITSILCILRVASLSLMASPKLNLTTAIFEQIHSKASMLTGAKDYIAGMIVNQIGGEKKSS